MNFSWSLVVNLYWLQDRFRSAPNWFFFNSSSKDPVTLNFLLLIYFSHSSFWEKTFSYFWIIWSPDIDRNISHKISHPFQVLAVGNIFPPKLQSIDISHNSNTTRLVQMLYIMLATCQMTLISKLRDHFWPQISDDVSFFVYLV